MMSYRILLAGATGVIGRRLIPLLRRAGHEVTGTTRSAAKIAALRDLGAEACVVDVFDAAALSQAVAAVRPEIVIHQLTDLPPGLDPSRMSDAIIRNARIRDEGTRNLITAAIAAGARRLIAQSIAWAYAPGPTPYIESDPLDVEAEGNRAISVGGVASLEHQVLNASPLLGIVLRYGKIYGPGTGTDEPSEAAIACRCRSLCRFAGHRSRHDRGLQHRRTEPAGGGCQSTPRPPLGIRFPSIRLNDIREQGARTMTMDSLDATPAIAGPTKQRRQHRKRPLLIGLAAIAIVAAAHGVLHLVIPQMEAWNTGPASHQGMMMSDMTGSESGTQARPAAIVTPVACEKLPNVPGKSLTTVIVTYPPGGYSPRHRHPGSVTGFVLKGTLRSQLAGTPAGTYTVGQSWFEPPGTIHLFVENTSTTEPAELLAIFVADNDCGPLSIPD